MRRRGFLFDVAFSVAGHGNLVSMTTVTNEQPGLRPSRAQMLRAFAAKDPSFDGVFYVAVRTTGIFCRPSCPSRPRPDHVEFFGSVRECLEAGYRPCLRCRPEEAAGAPPAWAAALMTRVRAQPDRPVRGSDLRALGITPERARRWFLQHHGMSFAAWCRGHRLGGAFARIRQGTSLDEAAFDSGFESHSGFRDAFGRTFGIPPGRSRIQGEHVVATLIESPLGALLAAAVDAGVCWLEYTGPAMLKRSLETIRQRLKCSVVPGTHSHLDRLRGELGEYFEGRRRVFTLQSVTRGTPFQERVWGALRGIPHGETIPYDELARRIGQPTAQRAVARANAQNAIAILIPCHRVVGKDGTLTGYGGGLWRKRLLLELERTGSLP